MSVYQQLRRDLFVLGVLTAILAATSFFLAWQGTHEWLKASVVATLLLLALFLYLAGYIRSQQVAFKKIFVIWPQVSFKSEVDLVAAKAWVQVTLLAKERGLKKADRDLLWGIYLLGGPSGVCVSRKARHRFRRVQDGHIAKLRRQLDNGRKLAVFFGFLAPPEPIVKKETNKTT